MQTLAKKLSKSITDTVPPLEHLSLYSPPPTLSTPLRPYQSAVSLSSTPMTPELSVKQEEVEFFDSELSPPKTPVLDRKKWFSKVETPSSALELSQPVSMLIKSKGSSDKKFSPESKEKKGRKGSRGYRNTPSLTLGEWHEFYWWPNKESIDIDQIKFGFSTLAIVLFGRGPRKNVYFYKNNLLLKKEESSKKSIYMSAKITLDAPENALFENQGFGFIPRQIPIVIASEIPAKAELRGTVDINYSGRTCLARSDRKFIAQRQPGVFTT